eukprot:CAMPEP_0115158018 /NCGR_PEP_ID=MMETSP0227-20121206/69349_1 /TAXON_ID=89957 /ORGANISM="Polarella glacialis, Strain CCMP 1383" /LENGTH=45 /DNA_ID= /DNA_START= /DNA_END= /DNA_ORIENTATION=
MTGADSDFTSTPAYVRPLLFNSAMTRELMPARVWPCKAFTTESAL